MKNCFILVLLCLFLASPVMARDGDIEICGLIESIDSSQVRLNGISYPLNSATQYEDENGMSISLSDFAPGDLIELRIRDGKVDQLEKEDEANCSGSGDDSGSDDDSDDDSGDDSDDDSGGSGDRERLCGKITAIGASSITVDNREFLVTSSTEFESLSGVSLTFSAFSVGDFVKLDIRNGSLHEVEYETSSSCRSQKIVRVNKKTGSDRSTLKRNRLRTKLLPATDVNTASRGSVRYESRAKNGKVRVTFKINVKVPVPSTVPSVTDSSDAALLALSVFIQRGADTLGSCTLAFNRVRNGKAEYTVDLRERDGGLRAKKGSCDIDLAQPGIQNGVPALTRGDSFSVVLDDLSSLLGGSL